MAELRLSKRVLETLSGMDMAVLAIETEDECSILIKVSSDDEAWSLGRPDYPVRANLVYSEEESAPV